jgi:hypothetical protein
VWSSPTVNRPDLCNQSDSVEIMADDFWGWVIKAIADSALGSVLDYLIWSCHVLLTHTNPKDRLTMLRNIASHQHPAPIWQLWQELLGNGSFRSLQIEPPSWRQPHERSWEAPEPPK